MSEHYYSARPSAKHEHRQFGFAARGREFTFVTDAGVFSKEHVDTGTIVLIKRSPLEPATRVLDLGCGYGVIGTIAGSCLPRAEVTMVDPNERACELARQNLRLNGVTNAEVVCGEGFAPLGSRTFDLVLTNPPIRAGKQVMYDLFHQAHERLVPGGRLIVVIRTNQGARSAEGFLAGEFERVEELERESGFRLYQAVKR